jgi:hypothetical protein
MLRPGIIRHILSIALSAALLVAGSANAADNSSVDPAAPTFEPNRALSFDIPRLAAKIKVDGKLDDPQWATARKLANFAEVEPGDNVKPVVETEAMIAYDDEFLYVAFHCYDSNPGAIRATITDRDRMFADDWVGVFIDTFRDQTNGYEFVVNPRGIQGDLRRARNNEDSSFDAVWFSGGQLTDDGWTAEIALPFRSLRFPNADVQSWGVHLFRTRPRESRTQLSWAPLSRDQNCFFCQAAVMGGIEGVNQGRNLEILPYVLASQEGNLQGSDNADVAWDNSDADGDGGVGLKYGVTPNHTLDATYNPDFSQIESDATQIDANRTFALFYPEKRPFFLEGADMFSSLVDAVYTRSINDPLLAGKFTGKQGKNTIAIMSAKDEVSPYVVPFEEQSMGAQGGDTYSTIVRYKRDILTESFIGLMATDRHAVHGGGSNTTYGLDGRVRFNDTYAINAQVLGSYTEEPNDPDMSAGFDSLRFGDDNQYDSFFNGENFSGLAAEATATRSGRHWNMDLWYQDYSPTFRAETGFVTQNDYRMAGFWTGYMLYFEEKSKWLERIEPALEAGRKYNHEGEFKDTWLSPMCWFRFKKQTYFWTGYLMSEEVFADKKIEGIRRWQTDFDTEFSKHVSFGTYTRLGHSVVRDRDDPRLGDEFSWGAYVTLRPTSQIRFDGSYDSFNLDELDGGANVVETYITRGKLTYQFTKNLFLRVVGEYIEDERSFQADPLLSYKINPFTVFFVGSSHSFSDHVFDEDSNEIPLAQGHRQTDRLFFVKFQYLLRV